MNGNEHSALWCEHLEPDRIGEHLVVSEADDLAVLPRELLSPIRVGKLSLRTWTVLERISTDPHLNEHVGLILDEVLMEVTQAIHLQATESQSTDLATGFAKFFSVVRSHITPHIAHEANNSLSEGGYFTAFLECELSQHAADIDCPADDAPETDRATYASRKLSLSRCLANTGRHDEALKTAREATDLYRTLTKHNPAAHPPRPRRLPQHPRHPSGRERTTGRGPQDHTSSHQPLPDPDQTQPSRSPPPPRQIPQQPRGLSRQ